MRSGRTHSLLFALAVAGEIFFARGAIAHENFNPWPVSAFVTDPMREGQSLVPSVPMRVMGPEASDTLISADPGTQYQEVEGYGAAITDSTLLTIGQLPPKQQETLLQILFNPRSGLNIRYLRVPIGASDFGVEAYTFLDLPPGSVDPELKFFKFSRARKVVAFLRRVKKINPAVKIMLSPWSPPAWMKTTGSLNGGSLKPEFFPAYAMYLAKSVQAFERAGITADSLTIQNEPFYANDKYPSMLMETADQITFIRDHLVPLFSREGIHTKILGIDHNYEYKADVDALIAALGDKIAGIAYHCYGGNYEQMQGTAAPIYQSECSGGTWGDNPGTFHFWLQGQVIGAGLLGSRLGMGWNLALDQKHGPYIGYCQNCRGLVDIDTNTKKVTYNPELIAMAQAGKFLHPGARRIATSIPLDPTYSNIGYINRNGSVVYVAENNTGAERGFVFSTPRGDFYRLLVPANGAVTLVAH
ncbi:MAG: glycoside hydrolase family 30 protein [Bdellovibrionota bacterium]